MRIERLIKLKKIFVIGILIVILLTFGISNVFFSESNTIESTVPSKDDLNNYESINNGLGVSIHLGLKEEDIQLIADGGFKWVRVDLFWERIETHKGQYNFEESGYDELNKWLKEKDIKPYYILNYSNKLYEDNRSIVTEQGREAFSKFVSEAVQRYNNQGVIWEIWNEPNLETFWYPQPSFNEYSSLVKEVAPIIKELDPTGIVVAPALAGLHDASLKWLEEVLKQGLLNYVDAVSVHPYRNDIPETVLYDYQKLRKLIAKYTDKETPIISGEWGYAMQKKPNITIDEMEQAEYLVRSVLVNSIAEIPISVWYDWKNDGLDTNNKEHNFGITWYSSNPKLSFLAIQTLSKAMDGYKFVDRIETTDSSNYILKFKNKNGKQILVYWTTVSSHNMDVFIDSGSGKIISMLGAVRNIKWTGKANLNFSKSPNYLVID